MLLWRMKLLLGGMNLHRAYRSSIFQVILHLSANQEHFSNAEESQKFVKKVIKPCVNNQRELIKCSSVDQ